MNDSKPFACFSPALFLFLRGRGLVPFSSGVHRVTGKNYTLFEQTPELHDALVEWAKQKPTNP